MMLNRSMRLLTLLVVFAVVAVGASAPHGEKKANLRTLYAEDEDEPVYEETGAYQSSEAQSSNQPPKNDPDHPPPKVVTTGASTGGGSGGSGGGGGGGGGG
eukprot:CAMPEP_0202499486 /NCGR_PEP_ID=MMETSP1361-20130828/29922_1 /ASSEMBLY_ACC=CAM_ASM_000849 /TAXON_ID=210615 /ORGANISM="Staurosira complex sp., Strain CCMP2646" /LENGTH=100 /DNA_ID=CAMNT_0049131695 /DNA_START=39 /DNA_END=337 /DNA_ORIENTATION=-